ncbi:AMP-binding protein [Labedaea rhizosphaerae]|uniref:Cyclohexanecarboxylate-CoA ligase/acyl-CoA synthetase n=1 Tax=Labedaea rhizosphaerae TaxID=598644 RepID=A0A4R6RXT5_LABRH|nr:AMP-binding protein [Labedaea rhizosphaerae]TDP91880.1 cyclohexanecarboxylate-CoA ligase/acyl-CoA synthetase [Labedaea rhizosphaerae]
MSAVDVVPSPTVTDRYRPEAIREFHERGWWRDGSAAALLDRWAEENPTKRFVSDGSVELDYATVREQAYGLAATLARNGVARGDRVVVQLPNWAEFIVSYLAITRLGAVLVPIMTVYREAEVAHVLRDSGAVAAITTGRFRNFDHAELFRTLRAELPQLRTLVIARGSAGADELAFDEACSAVPAADELGPHPDPDAPHAIVYTSGTESTAKGCVHTWNTIDFSGRGLATDVFEMTPDDVMFMPSPVAHATGLLVGVLVPLAVGAETHLIDIWEPNEGLKRIEQYRCTTTATATPFVRMALDAAPGSGRDLSSMRFWLCAGAPIPEALAREFEETFAGGALMPLYGCSEVLAATCCHLGDSIERRAGSDGSPALQGVRIKLVGADGDDVPTGEEGEICYWGPGAVLGYWRNPERTAATIDGEGWHHTGDLGRLDAEGYLRVTGRLKDIIIRGGTNISAAEVESHVIAHPDVAQVAVVGYPDDRLGEKACAVVVPRKGSTPTLAEITGFLRAERHIAPHKLPERLVLVDELPMTASGKIQKFKLRQTAIEER